MRRSSSSASIRFRSAVSYKPLQSRFGVKLTFRQLLGEFLRSPRLPTYIVRAAAAAAAVAEHAVSRRRRPPRPPTAAIEALMREQLQAMQQLMREQLQALARSRLTTRNAAARSRAATPTADNAVALG